MYLKTVRSETSKSFAKADAEVHVCALRSSSILIARSSEFAVVPIFLEYTIPMTESVSAILNTHHEKGNVMKRIVFRAEGKHEDACRLALLIMKCAFREQGVQLHPMYISDEQMPDCIKRKFIKSGGIWKEARYTSFAQAQAAIEGCVANGINAILMTDCYMQWECPDNILKGPLENLELYLQRNEVSVALVEEYSEEVPRANLPQINGAIALKEISLEARDRNNEMFCGEAFILPYGVLPAFFVERKDEQNRLDIRYFLSWYHS